MAGQRAPQRDGVAAQHAVARLVRVGRGDVKRVATLALHAAILHARALADRELRHRVRPVHAIREGDVALHHRGARPALHDHHVARVGDERLGRRDRDEHQVQRLVHFYSGRHVHERAIVEKGRVERREGVGGGRPGVAPEVPPDQVPVMPAGFRESPRGHAGGEPVRRRQGGDVPTVDEDQPAPARGPRHEAVDVPRRGRKRRLRPRQGEPRLRDRRHAREAPLLLLHRREAELGEARDRPLADLVEPRRRRAGPVAGERLERGDVTLLHVGRLGHATAAASRSQSYPFSSSSSASSFPPDLTIRPFERTWTTSG